ncbi:hypothetical protein HPB51_015249 [Rhipicephalus microplus]|uniref:Cysteine dioxygenase n=1 Tax=Rhipicephalus microplus TaxID=6941 RepID=A0A9J6DN88_RHIMP|nr:hypothetical protein HPB51_015249 [Rhipicephalus microplus]
MACPIFNLTTGTPLCELVDEAIDIHEKPRRRRQRQIQPDDSLLVRRARQQYSRPRRLALLHEVTILARSRLFNSHTKDTKEFQTGFPARQAKNKIVRRREFGKQRQRRQEAATPEARVQHAASQRLRTQQAILVLAGTLKEVRFDWPQTKDGVEAPMTKRGDTELQLNSVAYINDSLGLHRVENPSHCEPAVSLHLYCPPFEECSMFDQRTGHRSKSKVTFWSKYGQRTPFVSTAPSLASIHSKL